ncbi:MAG: YkgJ family cysteine cluster protein [Deltaproteobacteria bacterium]|nr:YkgJ family cysteine cluster protein [Deltaproteobacteria bacterium]
MVEPQNSIACDKCGACCRTYPVQVSLADAEREPRIFDAGLVIPGWLRSKEHHFQLHPLPFLDSCTFLDASSCCRIYNSRPQVCRAFEAGSPECAEARRRCGLKPLGLPND